MPKVSPIAVQITAVIGEIVSLVVGLGIIGESSAGIITSISGTVVSLVLAALAHFHIVSEVKAGVRK